MTDEYRPAYHFSAARSWLNDPNGLIWYDDEFHLFFQCNPTGLDWGNMSWGHAVSRDLVHWEELPVALTPGPDEHVYSGSVVADGDRLVAIFTSVTLSTGNQAQCLAFSTDHGRTWIRHAGNPVLDIGALHFRDPKVFRYGDAWVMTVVLSEDRVVLLYRSSDLLEWTHLSDFTDPRPADGPWECPDLFPLPLGDEMRWVLLVSVLDGAPAGGSGTRYYVGDFDGHRFEAVSWGWLDHGADNYAGVTFNDVPGSRRILVGWMSNWAYAARVPTSEFRGSMTLPRELSLAQVDGQLRLVQQPVVGDFVPVEHSGDTFARELRLTAELEPGSSARCGISLDLGGGESVAIGYATDTSSIFVTRVSSRDELGPVFDGEHHAPIALADGRATFTAYLDRASVEVFGGDGEAVLTDQVFPRAPRVGLSFFAAGGVADVASLEVAQVAMNRISSRP